MNKKNKVVILGGGFISTNLINYVDDRLGHDYRYAIDFSKIKNQLGWYPKTNIELGLKKTLNWYLDE